MDRSKDWIVALENSCRQLHLPEETVRSLKAAVLLRVKHKPNAFMQAANAVLDSIHELKEFITLHQEGYQRADLYSESDKDQIEVEVSSLVKECTASVEKLKSTVMAAAQAATAARASAVAAAGDADDGGGSGAMRGWINEQTVAHRHGVVLSLAEHLAAATSRFDRCRAGRYQQLSDLADRQRTLSIGGAGGGPISKGGAAGSTAGAIPTVGGTGRGVSLYASSLIGASGTAAVGKVAALGGVMLTRVKGVKEAVMGSGRGTPQPMTQQQLLLEAENQDLVAQLTTTALAVHGVERTVREIATLNQLFSTAVLSQAEMIETIYENAVDASRNIRVGNKEVSKTIEVNKSTQKYIFALLLAATLGVLFFDWFNS